MNNRGVTLLEVLIALSIFAAVIGTIFGLTMSLATTANVQKALTTANDQARQGMRFMTRELRQARRSTITPQLPGATLAYSIPVDTANGLAVDQSMNVAWSPLRTIRRDTSDANGDGLSGNQVIMVENGVVTVVASYIAQYEDTNANGLLDVDEDLNGNNKLDRGLWFEAKGVGIVIYLDVQQAADPQHNLTANAVELVMPRN